MPRQTLDITRFDAGIVALPDAKDIPMDAASWSLNVDVDTAPGKLTGRWTDDDYETAAPTKGLNASLMRWVQKADGTYCMVYYQPSVDQLRKVEDFHNASTGTDSLLEDFGSTARTVCAEKMNNVLHIGMGTGADSQWFGEIDVGQFGGSAPSGFQYLNAELAPPSVFPLLYKVHCDGTYLYGIQWQGQYVYKITLSTGAWEQSEHRFEKLQGICHKSGTDLFVLDYTGSFGVLHKISMTTMALTGSYPLDGWDSTTGELAANTMPSDIECTTNKVWFAIYSTADSGHVSAAVGKIVYNFAIASLADGTSFHPANVTFVSDNKDDSDGTWSAVATHLGWTPRRAFYKGSVATELGLLMFCYTAGAGLKQTDDSFSDPGMSLILMNESAAVDDNLNSATQRLCAIDFADGAEQSIVGTLFYINGGAIAVAASEQGNGAVDMNPTETNKILGFTTDVFVIGAGTAWDATKWITFTPDTSIAKAGSMTWCTGARITQGTSGTQEYAIVACDDPTSAEQTIGSVYSDGLDVVHTLFDNDPTYIAYSPISITTEASSLLAGDFSTDNKYYYLISYIYDGFQESPMIPTINRGTFFYDPASAVVACNVTISILSSAAFSSRITTINLYRAEGDDALDIPESFFRLVKSIDVKESWGTDTTDSATWGNKRSFVVADIGSYGPSYETNTGISEILETNTLNYQYSTQVMGYHFVGYIKNDFLTATKRMVVRSKQNAFDMFDWTTDFLYMPRNITAMGSFGGSLLVFAANEIYKVNPQGMYIEDTYTGIGCLGPLSLAETEAGLFFCDLNNIYVYDGSKITPIGDSIKFSPYSGSYSYPWTTYGSTYTRVVIPMNKLNSVLFCACKAGELIQTYVFHIPSKTWRFWNITGPAATSYFGGMTDKDGYAWLSHADDLYKIASISSPRSTFTWYSRDFDFGDASQPKMIDGIQASGTDGSTKTISSSGAAFAALTDHSYHDSIILQVAGLATTNLQSISILYRPMASKSS